MIRLLLPMLLMSCETGYLTVAGDKALDTGRPIAADSDGGDTPEQPDAPTQETDAPDTDPPVVSERDADGDGVANADDCAPSDAAVFPGARERCNNRDDNCDGRRDEGNACPCPTQLRQGRPYMVCPAAVEWSLARAACDNAGMTLVVIGDELERNFLRTFGGIVPSTWWIGLSDIGDEGNFMWVDGTTPGYTDWRNNQPDDDNGEDCVEFSTLPLGWNDARCAIRHPFICEPI